MQVNWLRKDRVALRAHQWKLTLGDTLIRDLSSSEWDISSATHDSDLWQLIHALNTSDWLTASYFLNAGNSNTLSLIRGARNTLFYWMATHNLDPLYRAADQFRRDRSEWQGQLQEAYQFGKLPAYGPSGGEESTVSSPYASRSGVVAHGRNLTRLIPIFQEYEKINQLYQKPGRTRTGAAIRFTQGHNWTYAHARKDLLDEFAFPPRQRRILVNWDAHRDLSSPFGHLSQEMSLLMQWMQMDHDRLLWLIRHAKTPEEITEVTSMISIAGWILPLLYSQHFAWDNISEIVLVVPREAMETSRKGYWPGYGSYTMHVGDAAIDHEEIDQLNHFLDQKQSTTTTHGDLKQSLDLPSVFFEQLKKRQDNDELKSIQSVSAHPSLQTVRDELLDVVQNTQNIKVHVADPDDLDSIGRILNGADIYLSVDVDFSGTTHLGGWYSASNPTPHYPLNDTQEEELRHQQLIERFEEFYRRNAANIKGVSVANSPDYTAEEARRRPAAKIFKILTGGTSGKQPNWISGESNRIIPPQLQKHPSRHLLISLAGILGISITGALFWHYLRSNQIRNDLELTDA